MVFRAKYLIRYRRNWRRKANDVGLEKLGSR